MNISNILVEAHYRPTKSIMAFTIFISHVAIYEFFSMSGFRINLLIAF